MTKKQADPLREGFESGQHFRIRCPYSSGSIEADAWKIGWADGVMKDYNENYRDNTKFTAWQKLLKKLNLF